MQIKHFVYAGIIALYGCTSNNYESRAWETAKSSTSNQTELTSFLEHYKLSGDSEKYEAACFLVSNMPGKHSAGEDIVYDIDVVKSDSLISSLEESFLLKEESSFLKDYSFEQFLEYILPYRIVDEPLEYYWKQDCKRHFRSANMVDIIQAAKDINSQVKLNLSPNMRIVDFAKTMVMGRFEGANQSDFSDAEEIYRITEIPESKIQKVNISTDKAFRYVRYLRPKGTFSIAEFSVYHSDGTPVSFRPIACEAIQDDSAMMNVFDGNPLTYYQVGGGVDMWVGADLCFRFDNY